MRRYTNEHAWVLSVHGSATVGITAYAQQQLGDIVYVDLPQPGTAIAAGQPMGTVESVKSVSELYAPVSGHVIAVNPMLASHPERLNEDPEGEAWMIQVKLTMPSEVDALLDHDAYAAFVKGEASP